MFRHVLTRLRPCSVLVKRVITVRAMSAAASSEVQFSERNRTGVITLDRPKQLNALTFNMVNLMYQQLIKWNSTMDMVIIKGSGGRAFCAGGDVVALTRDPPPSPANEQVSTAAAEFFRQEYQLDYLTGTISVPYVALLNGVTMGGGCGVSMHGKYRVCTEKTMLAMPETAIGLFPDVGGSYFLSRLPKSLGMFLALSGYRLKGLDVLHAGLATHCCRSDQLDSLLDDLVEGDVNDLSTTLNRYTEQYGEKEPFSLADHLDEIDRCFCWNNQTSASDIISRLQAEGSDFCNKIHSSLLRMSPTSLCITVEQLKRGSQLSLAQCFAMEMRLAVRCADDWDFYEGVRALLVDKDQSPKWRPSSVEEVSKDRLQRYFSPLPQHRELNLTS